jgi:diguanylate cyclase (GGDEF)-like protein
MRPRVRALYRGHAAWVLTAAVLVLGGALASFFGAGAVARSDTKEARLAFHLASTQIASSLKLSIQHEEDLVVSASAFFTSNPDASPADFDRWMEAVRGMERFPELQNIGLVVLVRQRGLAAFKARIATNPVRPLGPQSTGPAGALEVVPPGRRPFYCLATAGMTRSLVTYLPAGMDYCTLSPQLMLDREFGITGYAPVIDGNTPKLGVETPVYRGGHVPATRAARERAFVGWLGELLEPNVVLRSALAGHANLGVNFRYDSRFSRVAFRSGSAPRGAQTTTIPLLVGRAALGNSHEGWSVQTFGAPVSSGVFGNWNSLALFAGGTLLSAVLGLLMLVLATGRMRALSLVRERTHELLERNIELTHQALHDTLTGLPNRALVLDRTNQLLARAARQPNAIVGALFIDIDGFKHVNDNLGHAAGDELIRTVGERLRAAMRSEDTVGRLGGDEFVVLGELTVEEVTLDALAERLIEALRQPVELDDGRTIAITASIGVAEGRYETADALLRDADLALYAAKAAGKNRCAHFEPDMRSGAGSNIELASGLSAASPGR